VRYPKSRYQLEWEKRWADMPTVQVTSYMSPAYDGDMAELHELFEEILTYPARDVAALDQRMVYHLVADKLGFSPTMLSWRDPVADMLKRWRDE